MSWKHRVRDLVLAGGTLTAIACSNRDFGGACCNANGDPCCASQHCGAAVTPDCTCQMNGGTWNYSAGGGGACESSVDSGLTDSDFDDVGRFGFDSSDSDASDSGSTDADAALRDANGDVAHD